MHTRKAAATSREIFRCSDLTSISVAPPAITSALSKGANIENLHACARQASCQSHSARFYVRTPRARLHGGDRFRGDAQVEQDVRNLAPSNREQRRMLLAVLALNTLRFLALG